MTVLRRCAPSLRGPLRCVVNRRGVQTQAPPSLGLPPLPPSPPMPSRWKTFAVVAFGMVLGIKLTDAIMQPDLSAGGLSAADKLERLERLQEAEREGQALLAKQGQPSAPTTA